MGHTQWMPEVWLHMGVDYDRTGRITPFGKPDDSLAGTARYLLERGKYRRGEAWGCEVNLPSVMNVSPTTAPGALTPNGRSWACVAPMVRLSRGPSDQVKLWRPVGGGPAFLVGQNFRAVYILQSLHQLHAFTAPSRRPHSAIRPSVSSSPAASARHLDEVKEIQRRLIAQGSRPTASTAAPAARR